MTRRKPPARKKKKAPQITDAILAASRRKRKVVVPQYFTPALHPPSVCPPKEATMAMDSSLSWAQESAMRSAFLEGTTFLGYPELSILAQRAEYRVISETIATEMVRKGFKLQANGDAGKKDKKKAKRISELSDWCDNMGVLDHLKRVTEQDGYFGRGHMYVDTGDTENRDELMKPLILDKAKVNPKRPVLGFREIEAVWCYPTNYEASDPLRPNWYNPDHWHVNGKQTHKTRLLTFIGREVPDLLKPAYSFGGLSLSQMAKPYVENWLRTRQSVADIVHAFSVMVLSTDLSTVLQGGGDQLFRRAELFNNLRDNLGLMMINKDTEDFKNVSASLASLDTLQARSQEHMAAVSRIPIVKLLGIQPQGLNADSEGIMRAFYDTIAAYQRHFFDRRFKVILRLGMLSLWGEIDTAITHKWEPLREMDEKEASEIRKTDAETGATLIDAGVLHPIEERERIAHEEDTLYPGLDIDDVPEVPSEEDDIDIRGEEPRREAA